MLNLQPLFQRALAPFAPPPVIEPSVVHFFDVTVNGEKMTFAAKSNKDAITRAMELFLEPDADDTLPEGVSISCICRRDMVKP